MLPRFAALAASAFVVLAVACSDEESAPSDAEPPALADASRRPDAWDALDGGRSPDASAVSDASSASDGSSSASDGSSAPDAFGAHDAREDGGSPEPDATSTGADAGFSRDAEDAAVTDGGAPLDGAPLSDLGTIPPATEILRPTVTIEQAASQADPASAAPIRFAVVFSKVMDSSTLVAADFAIEPRWGVTAQLVDSGDHRRFELQLTSVPDHDAIYTARLPRESATDLGGRFNEDSTSADNRVRYEVMLPTVVVRPAVQNPTVVNTLPIVFRVEFQQAMDPATIDVSDVVNEGTATGVVWSMRALAAGISYEVQATAVGSTGTVIPAIPPNAADDAVRRQGNLHSVYLGEPITYTPLPILRLAGVSGDEGDTLEFRATITGTPPPGVLFDWATRDGTALAGSDYVAGGGTDLPYPQNVSFVRLRVAATPDDAEPEGHETFQVVVSNVRGAVFVANTTAVGTIVNDDRGYWSFGANNGFYQDAAPSEILVHGDQVYSFGKGPRDGAQLHRHDRVTGMILASTTFGGGLLAAGLAANDTGYYVGAQSSDGCCGFVIFLQDWSTNSGVETFGDFGEVRAMDPALTIYGLRADASSLYAFGTKSSTAALIQKRDALTGADDPAFGAGGSLVIDLAFGTASESIRDLAIDGSSIFVIAEAGGAFRIEKRDAATGALVASFGSGGSLGLPLFSTLKKLALFQGSPFVFGEGQGGSLIARLDPATGASSWTRASVMTVAGGITAGASGIYIGGVREDAEHIEHWALDGTPLWAQTWLRDRTPAGATALAIDGYWLHVAGFHTYSRDRDWVYERRYAPDGYLHTNNPGQPRE